MQQDTHIETIHEWIIKHNVKTERGYPLDFYEHPFMFDIYADFTPDQCGMKAAQIGFTQEAMTKMMYLGEKMNLEMIYTLPTDTDVKEMVGGKMNRIIDQNPHFQTLTKDKDTIEQKKIAHAMAYFRGTWTQKASMMVPADVLLHDEIDTSKQDVIEGYQSRMAHSRFKWRWTFSHPSVEGYGVHAEWLRSDQKHWLVTCGACKKSRYLKFPDSICMERQCYQCRVCHAEITTDMRRQGHWLAKYPSVPRSGYHIPLMIAPWIEAPYIIEKSKQPHQELFYNRVLGLPYVGKGNKITENEIMQNWVNQAHPKVEKDDPVVIGVDTGLNQHFVVGSPYGLFICDSSKDYSEVEQMLKIWPKAIAIFDQGGDLTEPRKIRERYPGRVILCYYRKDRKSERLIDWGKDKERGRVLVDRNRMISLLGGEFRNKRIPLYGPRDKWMQFAEQAKNLYRVEEENTVTQIPDYVWKRSGPDHLFHAALYCRVGLEKYLEGGFATILHDRVLPKAKKAIVVLEDGTSPGELDEEEYLRPVDI